MPSRSPRDSPARRTAPSRSVRAASSWSTAWPSRPPANPAGRFQTPHKEKAMRFLVMVRATKMSEAGIIPDDPKLFEDMGKFNEELVNAGIMQSGEGLQPSSKGARIRFSADNKRTVVDGPFPETK